jgi:hypothetical protein
MSLEQAVVAVPVRVPWYRRLFRRSSSDRMQAGERPRSMAERGRPRRPILGYLVSFALLAIILGAIGSYVAVPDVRAQVDTTIADLRRQYLPELVDVTPVARSEAVGRVIDRNLVTWWEGDGDRPSLVLRFDPPVDLGNIGVSSGANGDEFPDFRRPLQLRLEAGDAPAVTVDLDDTATFQPRGIDLRDVSQLRVTVLSSTGPARAPVAIRDLEFKAVR